ncbi:acid protease [Ramaria rubella]|nr:acid protease [Ramaria rubella]
MPHSTFSASIPIVKRASRHLNKRQGTQSGAIGLGDIQDTSYSIEVTIGSDTVPVIFDTGSSDLWSISTGCSSTSCGDISGTPQISSSSLKASGVDVQLNYGDSSHPTFASGSIGSGTVSVAGLSLDNQFLAACDKTNTNLSAQGLSGIFGIGFPSPLAGSVIFAQLLGQSLGPGSNGQLTNDAALTDAFISSLSSQGPLLSRLVANGQLKQPMFTVTLEREDVEVGGNLGQLTIGELPAGVSNDSLTWVPVRLYSLADGGLASPSTSPNEIYPSRWEVPLDAVVLNGQTLAVPSLPDGVSYTALIDSGTSFLAGPQSVISAVYSTLGGNSFGDSQQLPQYPCSTPQNLSYVIGGKTFAIDPRDFVSGQFNPQECTPSSLSPTDPPAPGSLMSWILGDPFMKSNLVAFYYGNLTHPSVDPPRMGFLSTVPSNVDDLYQADVKAALNDGGFIGMHLYLWLTSRPLLTTRISATQVSAPFGTFIPTSTDAEGVVQAPTGTAVPQDSDPQSTHKNEARTMRTPLGAAVIAMVALSVVTLL